MLTGLNKWIFPVITCFVDVNICIFVLSHQILDINGLDALLDIWRLLNWSIEIVHRICLSSIVNWLIIITMYHLHVLVKLLLSKHLLQLSLLEVFHWLLDHLLVVRKWWTFYFLVDIVILRENNLIKVFTSYSKAVTVFNC